MFSFHAFVVWCFVSLSHFTPVPPSPHDQCCGRLGWCPFFLFTPSVHSFHFARTCSNIKFGGGRGGSGRRVNKVALVTVVFAGARFCPSTVKIIWIFVTCIQFIMQTCHALMTLSGSICALARLGSPLSGGSSRHAKSTPQAPSQKAFATPQSLPEIVEGGDPLGEGVAQRGDCRLGHVLLVAGGSGNDSRMGFTMR